MVLNNSKISNKQLKKLIVFDIFSISMLIIPNLAVSGAGKDGLLAIVLGSLAALVYALLILFFCSQLKTDYLSYCQQTLGRFITFLFGMLYLLKFFIATVFVLTLFTTIIHETILPNTSHQLILLFLFLVSIYYGSKQFETRARLVEILFYIVLIPLFLLFLLGIFKINPANLFPLFTTSPQVVFKTSYSVFLTYSAVEMLLFVIPSVTDQQSKNKRISQIVMAVLICAGLNLIIYLVVIGLMGSQGAVQNIWSTVSVMQMIEIPGGFVHRQDAIMLTLWMVSIFTIISTLIYFLCFITKSITNSSHQKYFLWFYAVILFVITMRPLPLETVYAYLGKYFVYIGLPQSILMPLLLILVAKIRFRKERYDEQSHQQA